MAAIRREIKEVETQLDIAQAEFSKVNDQLRSVQQARMNAEEELVAQNTRLKQMLDELAMRKETSKRRDVEQEDAKVTVADLTAVAVTVGPGLALCLTVGVEKAPRGSGTARGQEHLAGS